MVGTRPNCLFTGAVPCFSQTRQGCPSIKLRPKHCGQPIPGITAGVGEQQLCTIHTWARSRYVAHLPDLLQIIRKEKGAGDVDDMLGLLGDDDAQAAEDESSDSEGSVGPPTMGSDPESGEDGADIPAATQQGKEWCDSWRFFWGGAVEAWKTFLAVLEPTLVCIARQLSCPAVLF